MTRLITALDIADPARARVFATSLDPALTRLKIGNEAFTAGGPALVEDLQRLGFDVFLDLKYHDIPNTVAAAVTRAAALGVWMVNVHAGGGRRMLEAAREALARHGRAPSEAATDTSGTSVDARGGTRLVGVTVLTSLEREDLVELGLHVDPVAQVERLATLVRDAGLDGVVCSPRELATIRALAPSSFLTVTPGIRPATDDVGAIPSTGAPDASPPRAPAARDDQRRVSTAREAILAGADHLVVGRPVTRAPDPLVALRTLGEEIDAALAERGARAVGTAASTDTDTDEGEATR